MWWLYTHDCLGSRWTLLTNQPDDGRWEVPAELREVGNGFHRMGHHLGIRYTANQTVSVQTMSDAGARFLRTFSANKPIDCPYEEPVEDPPIIMKGQEP